MRMVIIFVTRVITDHHYEGGDYHEHLCDKSDQSRWGWWLSRSSLCQEWSSLWGWWLSRTSLRQEWSSEVLPRLPTREVTPSNSWDWLKMEESRRLARSYLFIVISILEKYVHQASGQVHVFNFCNLGNVYSAPCHHRSRGCCHQYQLLPYSFVVSIINIILLLILLNRLWKEVPSSQEEVFQPHQDRLLLLSSISLKS